MKNVIMTPHTASMVPDFWNKLTALLQTNFVNFSRGEKLMNEMDKKKDIKSNSKSWRSASFLISFTS